MHSPAHDLRTGIRACRSTLLVITVALCFGVALRIEPIAGEPTQLVSLPSYSCTARAEALPDHHCITLPEHGKIQHDCDEMNQERHVACGFKLPGSCEAATKLYNMHCKGERNEFHYDQGRILKESLGAAISAEEGIHWAASSKYKVSNDGKTLTKDTNGWNFILGTDEMSGDFELTYFLAGGSTHSSLTLGVQQAGETPGGDSCSCCAYLRPTGDHKWVMRTPGSSCPFGKSCGAWSLVNGHPTYTGDTWKFRRSGTTVSVLKNDEVMFTKASSDVMVAYVSVHYTGDSVNIQVKRETGPTQLPSTAPAHGYTTALGTAGPGAACHRKCIDVGLSRPNKRAQGYGGEVLPKGWCYTDENQTAWGGCGGCQPGKHGESCQHNCHSDCATCTGSRYSQCTGCATDRKLQTLYQSFPGLSPPSGRAGSNGGYFGNAEDHGMCVPIDGASDAPYCYPPKDVIYEFKKAGKEMAYMCTKGSVVKYQHQVFWWAFISNMQTQARDAVIAAAGGIATTSNWRHVVAVAYCRIEKRVKCFVSNADGVADQCFVSKTGTCKQVKWLRAPTGYTHGPNCICSANGGVEDRSMGHTCSSPCKEHVDTQCAAVKPFAPMAGAGYWCKEAISTM